MTQAVTVVEPPVVMHVCSAHLHQFLVRPPILVLYNVLSLRRAIPGLGIGKVPGVVFTHRLPAASGRPGLLTTCGVSADLKLWRAGVKSGCSSCLLAPPADGLSFHVKHLEMPFLYGFLAGSARSH
jgi:hypothetical protein